MVWTNREIHEKIERINELKELGLNTPRMFYLKKFADPDDLMEAFEWAAKINWQSPNQIFNVRTYNYSKEIETSQTTHYTDIAFEELEALILDINLKLTCMIDAETPDNGRFAGNIIIEDVVSPTGRVMTSKFTIEYCEKDLRAMVRDHDKSLKGELKMLDKNLPFQLKMVIDKANKFTHGKILEWTWFCIPAGDLQENLVWWEYRGA
jgi:hypothetical protein